MKKSVLEWLAGQTDTVELDEGYITQYFSKTNAKQKQLLVRAAYEAWDSLLSVCGTCPTRCISEKERYCELFDEYEEW
jgi:hypothetical protein